MELILSVATDSYSVKPLYDFQRDVDTKWANFDTSKQVNNQEMLS